MICVLLVRRSSLKMKTPGDNDDAKVESGGLFRDRVKVLQSKRSLALNNMSLLSGIAYCLSSSSMILVTNMYFPVMTSRLEFH